MKRPRPYIPLDVRCRVALRQLGRSEEGIERWMMQNHRDSGGGGYKAGLARLLSSLTEKLGVPGETLHLDHDPALILRPFKRGRYTPDANDPDWLIYRTTADHLQKTTGRKPGALKTVTTKGSDIGLKAKFDRLEGRTKKKKSRPIPQRKNPWPKGRGFQR